jgi:hypothetical protein
MRVGKVTASLIAIALVGPLNAQAQAPAATPGWVETPATCARLQALVTTADIEKITGRKGAAISIATPDQTDGCAIAIRLPKEKTPNASIAGIGLSLRQHVSPAKAAQNVKIGLDLATVGKDAANSPPPREIARDARGRMFQFKYVYDYASAIVDATELTVNVRDQALNGPVVAAALGQLVFERALASADVAKYATSANEVLTHLVVKPMLLLIERCSQPDAPAHEETRKAMAASAFNRLTVVPASTFSDYTQRWLTQLRADEMLARQVAVFSGPLTPALSEDCKRSAQELPAMERSMQPLLKLLQSK